MVSPIASDKLAGSERVAGVVVVVVVVDDDGDQGRRNESINMAHLEILSHIGQYITVGHHHRLLR